MKGEKFLLLTFLKFVLVNGEQQWVACNRMKPEEVVKWMELIKTQSKDTLYIRYRKYQHTDFPSIQGPWTPFFNMDPALNLSEFPNVSLKVFLA